jgi:Zn-finger protein
MVAVLMVESVLSNWTEGRRKLLVTRVLEAGLEFDSNNVPKIIREMSYNVQKVKHPNDCSCYASSPCHNGFPNLNCFMCDCPNYDLDSRDGAGVIGGCRKYSTKGVYIDNPVPGKSGLGKKVWDCSSCSAYHSDISVEIFLRFELGRYASIAAQIKLEKVQRGFSDFKSFGDFLSKELLKRE